MMISVRKSADRGVYENGSLKTLHTFSFAGYKDEDHVNWGGLKALNQSFIEPRGGFHGTHHNKVDIFTFVIQGKLEHSDSLGNKATLDAGDVQVLSTGTGVTHKEVNPSLENWAEIIEIWIRSKSDSIKRSYAVKKPEREEKLNKLYDVSGKEAGNAEIYTAILEEGKDLEYEAFLGRNVFVQLVSGEIEINGQKLANGDGAYIEDESLNIVCTKDKEAELILIDSAR